MDFERVTHISGGRNIEKEELTLENNLFLAGFLKKSKEALLLLGFGLLRRLSLKFTLLISFIVFSLVPVLLSSSWLVSRFAEHGEKELKYASEMIARSASLVVTQKINTLNDHFLILESSSTRTKGYEYFSSLPSGFTWFAFLDIKAKRNTSSGNISVFDEVFGHSGNAPKLESRRFRHHLKLAVNNPERIVYSNRVFNKQGVPSIFVLRSNSNKTKITIAALSLEAVESFSKNIALNADQSISIIDGNGYILSQTSIDDTLGINNRHNFQNSNLDRGIDFLAYDLINDLVDGQSGSQIYHSNLTDQDMLAGYAPLISSEISEWGIVVSKPLVSTEQANMAIWKTSYLTLLIIILFAVIFSYCIAGLILRPFNFLAKVADRCSSDTKSGMEALQINNCSRYLSNLYFVEVTELVKTFKKLNGELLSYHERMEIKVAERKRVLDFENKERERVAKQIGYDRSYDSLTQLPNYSLFNERLSTAMICSKSSESSAGVIVIHLHGIDLAQKRYGHIVSDSVLKSVTKNLKACLGDDASLARTEAYEFMALLVNIETLEDAMSVVYKLRHLTLTPATYGDNSVSATPDVPLDIHIGFAMSDEESTDADDLVSRARASVERLL